MTLAAVTSGATGTVTFHDGTTALGAGTISSGVATLTTSSLAAGTHSITAQYGGDANYNGAVSTPLSQTVNQASSTVALASSLNPSTFGTSVTLTATVTAGATGTVTFDERHNDQLGTGNDLRRHRHLHDLDAGGGGHALDHRAQYSGDTNYNEVTSSAVPTQE